jgi:hypothetical protein
MVETFYIGGSGGILLAVTRWLRVWVEGWLSHSGRTVGSSMSWCRACSGAGIHGGRGLHLASVRIDGFGGVGGIIAAFSSVVVNDIQRRIVPPCLRNLLR